MCCSHISLRGSLHPDKTGQSAKKCTNEESNRNGPMGSFTSAAHEAQQQCNNDSEIGEYFPFSFQKSHSTRCNIIADFFHSIGTCLLLRHPIKLDKSVNQPKQTHGRNQVDQFVHKQ